MAMTLSDMFEWDRVRNFVHLVGERFEGDPWQGGSHVKVYELDGIRYERYSAYSFGTWITPAGAENLQ
jgi:hypothetical protein